MKVFKYNLNEKNEGPAAKLPLGSLTGYFHDGEYYGVALIDNFINLLEFNPVEITPLEFNQLFTQQPSEENPNPVPALVIFENSIRNKYAEQLRQVVIPYSPDERETWFAQVQEAQAYQANTLIDSSLIPLLTTIANTRNITVDSVANNIITKNTNYRIAVGQILGEQQNQVQTLWTV